MRFLGYDEFLIGEVSCGTHYNCPCGSRGRPVGKFFTIKDGEVIWQPPGTSVSTLLARGRVPVWSPRPLYNSLHLWHCEGEGHNFETTLFFPDSCNGIGENDVGHRGGVCPDPLAYQETA